MVEHVPRLDDFARAFVSSHGDGKAAALAAGYSESTAASCVATYLRHPRVLARIAEEADRQRAVSGIIGLSVLQKIAQSEQAAGAARVTAARTLMEYAGMVGAGAKVVSKDPADMSPGELRIALADIERELGNRARPVNEPIARPVDDQLADMLE